MNGSRFAFIVSPLDAHHVALDFDINTRRQDGLQLTFRSFQAHAIRIDRDLHTTRNRYRQFSNPRHWNTSITLPYRANQFATDLGLLSLTIHQNPFWGRDHMHAQTLAHWSHRLGADINAAPAVSYTHLRAHETPEHLVCRLLLEKKKK